MNSGFKVATCPVLKKSPCICIEFSPTISCVDTPPPPCLHELTALLLDQMGNLISIRYSLELFLERCHYLVSLAEIIVLSLTPIGELLIHNLNSTAHIVMEKLQILAKLFNFLG